VPRERSPTNSWRVSSSGGRGNPYDKTVCCISHDLRAGDAARLHCGSHSTPSMDSTMRGLEEPDLNAAPSSVRLRPATMPSAHGDAMKRRSKAGGKPINRRRRKTPERPTSEGSFLMSIDFPFFRFTTMGCFVVTIVAICQPALAICPLPPPNIGGPDVCLTPPPTPPVPPPPPSPAIRFNPNVQLPPPPQPEVPPLIARPQPDDDDR
jgi:hypothetical protein